MIFLVGISEATDLINMYNSGMMDAQTAMQMLSDISGKQPVSSESGGGGGGGDAKGPARKRSLEPPIEASSDDDDDDDDDDEGKPPPVGSYIVPRLILKHIILDPSKQYRIHHLR